MARTLIIGTSGGIGMSLLGEFQNRRHEIVGLSRSVDGLDITNEASIEDHLSQLEGSFDNVIVATGALSSKAHGPEKALKGLNAEAMTAQFELNAIGPMLVLKHAIHLMPRDRRTVFAALSARVGSIGDNRLGGWYSYRASKAALNQLLRTASIEMARTHKQSICVGLHPGTVATNFTANYKDHSMVEPHEAATNLVDVIDGLKQEDTGMFFDWAGKKIPW